MTHSVGAVHAVGPIRRPMEPRPTPEPGTRSGADFAPELARACGQIRAPAAMDPAAAAGVEATVLPLAQPGEPLALDEQGPTQQQPSTGDGSSEDEQPEDGEEASSSAATPVEPAPQCNLIAASPLILRLQPVGGGAAGQGSTGDGGLAGWAAVEAGASADQTTTDAQGKPGSKPAPCASGSPSPDAGTPARTAAAKPVSAPASAVSPASNAEVTPPAGGIPVADQTEQMHAMLEMYRIAEPDEQTVPAKGAVFLAEHGNPHAASTAHGATPLTTSGPLHPATLEYLPSAEPVAHRANVDPTAAIASLVAGAVVKFRRSSAEEFDVAITPDPQTEICLHVRLQGDGAEVQAELRRGDAAALAGRWPDLQEKLAQQGIKLAALAESGDLASDGGQRDGRHTPQEDSDPEAPLVTTLPVPGIVVPLHSTTNSPTPVVFPRGWETWA